jgi:membrane protein required for colicin V production
MAIDLGWVDIGLALFLAVSVVVGLARGFVFELLSLGGWFAAYFSARWFAPVAQQWVHVGDAGSSLNHVIAFAGVFIVALVAWSLCARLVRAMIRATPLSAFDRVLGAGFGFVRGVLVLLVIATIVGVSPWSQSAPWRGSQGAAWLDAAIRQLKPLFVNDAPPSPTA